MNAAVARGNLLSFRSMGKGRGRVFFIPAGIFCKREQGEPGVFSPVGMPERYSMEAA